VIAISEQVITSAVVQRIIFIFLINENVKPAEILMRLRAHFGEETLSRIQVYGIRHLNKARQIVKTCEDYTFCWERYGQRFWGSKGVLLIDFLTEQRTTNAAYIRCFLRTE
jgi:hypothetical protein